jgi:hypothetical protein
MRVINVVIVGITILLNGIGHSADNRISLTQDIYTRLCGIWYTSKSYNSRERFSWGESNYTPNISLIFDLGDDNPYFHTGSMSVTIAKVIKEDNIYIVSILLPNMKSADIHITYIDKDTIVFNEKDFNDSTLSIDASGSNNKYYRIDGPKIKYFNSKIPNLRIREDMFLDSKVIRLLNSNEKLLLITRGKRTRVIKNGKQTIVESGLNETIDGVKGNWIKVLTEKNEIGWCFDAYLEQIKE